MRKFDIANTHRTLCNFYQPKKTYRIQLCVRIGKKFRRKYSPTARNGAEQPRAAPVGIHQNYFPSMIKRARVTIGNRVFI